MKQKKRKCRIKAEGCEVAYTPFNSLQKCCYNPKCIMENHRREQEKKRLRDEKRERQELKEAKERVKTRGEWLKEAQAAFNKYIRLRDSAEPCISCGRFHEGQYHAGHYLTVSAHPELRFEELNNNKQCAPCNNHLSGNLVNYRINLIKKIGLDKVEWLEGPHDPKKYTIEEIKEIKQKYSKLARELEKELNQ